MLGHDIAAALPELRAHAESLMVDTCRIDRATGATTIDPVTLEETPVYATVYEGKARIQRSAGLTTQESTQGGFEFAVGSVVGQLPITATGIVRGDRLTVTVATLDPDLLGLVATVTTNLSKTHGTKRTLVCEEVSP